MEETVTDESSSMRERVFFSARDGMSLTLYALLHEKSPEELDDLLNTEMKSDGVRCTPLLAAARHGREAAVRILLDKFMPPVQLETEGTVKFDEYVIEGATALWCAAGAGHLAVVKRLVQAGADVNHATKTISTPLRAACFDGRLDIVKYLVRHGADIHKANKYNNTCLMIASYKGHSDVVQFLLDSGARVNERALCGATAMHFAAECGHASVVCQLLDHGAKMLRNQNGVSHAFAGLTPLLCAAERARANVVEILSLRPEVTRAQAIEAIELLGASFANDKEHYCLEYAYQYMHIAMCMRFDYRKGLLKKKINKPIPAYDNWRETTNVGVAVVKDLLRFAQVFSQMIHIGIELPLEQVSFVLEKCAVELRQGIVRLADPANSQDRVSLSEEYESNVRTALYLVSVAAHLLDIEPRDEVAADAMRRAVFRFSGARLYSRQTLLHMAVDRRTPVDDFHTSDVCQFPCTRTARLLLECGVDPNALDAGRRSALHTALISYQLEQGADREQMSDALCGVVMDLLTHGAHVDGCDRAGVTPLVASIGGPAEVIIRAALLNPRLTCLAATALAAHAMRYDATQVPRELHAFLALHGVPSL